MISNISFEETESFQEEETGRVLKVNTIVPFQAEGIEGAKAVRSWGDLLERMAFTNNGK